MLFLGTLTFALCLTNSLTLQIGLDMASGQTNFGTTKNDAQFDEVLASQVLKSIIRNAIQNSLKKYSSPFLIDNSDPLEQLKDTPDQGMGDAFMKGPIKLLSEDTRTKRRCGGMMSPWQNIICRTK